VGSRKVIKIEILRPPPDLPLKGGEILFVQQKDLLDSGLAGLTEEN